MSDTWVALGIISPLIVCLIAYLVSFDRGSRKNLGLWATASGYQILDVKSTFLRKDPFGLNSSRWNRVFLVKLIDRDGNRRAAWVKVKLTWGSDDTAEVIWNE